MRGVAAPINDAMLVEIPRRARVSSPSARMPGNVVVEIDFLLLILRTHRIVQGPHRFAFAENLQRDALTDVALRAPVDK
jgi:hypothetical protein